MIYFNNAGTSWPKPKEVNQALQRFGQADPSEWSKIFDQGVQTVGRFFNLPDADRFLFTTSCTAALSIAFSDFQWKSGDRLLISSMEHHALSRWYHKLQYELGIKGKVIPRANNGPMDLDSLEEELNTGAQMVAISMASNVTGEILPYEDVLALCKQYGAFCLLDGAQAAGIVPIDINILDPAIFVFAGHKGTLGPQGIGGLYIAPGVPMNCPSAQCEITPGEVNSGIFPSYCDTGSVNMAGVAGLTAGLQWLEQEGWLNLKNHRKQLVSTLRDGLARIPGVKIAGVERPEFMTGAVSVITEKMDTESLTSQLLNDYKIKAGGGFHCAPLAHEALGTAACGTTRFSVGPMNTLHEVNTLLDALRLLLE